MRKKILKALISTCITGTIFGLLFHFLGEIFAIFLGPSSVAFFLLLGHVLDFLPKKYIGAVIEAIGVGLVFSFLFLLLGAIFQGLGFYLLNLKSFTVLGFFFGFSAHLGGELERIDEKEELKEISNLIRS